MQAEGLELAEVGADLALPARVLVVPAGTEVGEPRGGVREKVSDDDEDGASDVGDVTTLANPEMVESIRHHVQSEKLAHGEVPRELTEAEEAEIKAFGAE